jgi:cell division protease FtsH
VFARKWSRRTMSIAAGCAVVVVALAAFILHNRTGDAAAQVPFSDLLRHLDRGEVAAIVVNGDALEFTLSNGQPFRTVAPANYVTANAAFVPELAKKNVRIDVRSTAEPAAVSYGAIVLGLGFVGLLGFTLYRVSSGRIPALESKTREADKESSTVTFADVAGVDEAKEEVKEIVDFLKEPQRFAAIGGRIPKGVLLVGPPGTGKTLLARSIAGEANVPFLFASGSDFVEMYAGVGASRIRKMFKDARRHPACIVFIDELDAVGRARGGSSLSHEEREQTLNQLLVEMDGFAPNQGIVVIAATNRADILDPALLRPGRFDRQVTVGAPDVKGREQILKIHARKVALDDVVDLRQVARGTPGFSGAELANLVNEAALFAVRSGRQIVTDYDFDQARDKVLMGAERKSLTMSEHERITCAYHESGHAVVAALLPAADPLHKVTIIPRGRALGVTMQLPERDHLSHTKQFLESRLAIMFGGRIAEEIIFGPENVTTGAASDIQVATQTARGMITAFGMSEKLGRVRYQANEQEVFLGHAVTQTQNVSEATAQLIDQEVRRLIEEAEGKARQILTDHLEDLHLIAKALLEYETLSNDEIGTVLRGEKVVRDDTGGAGSGSDRRRRASVPSSTNPAPGGANPEPQPGV